MDQKQNGKNKIIKLSAAAGALAVIVVGLYFLFPLLLHGDNNVNTKPQSPDTIVVEQPISLKISAVGDVMVHKPQIPAQYQSETNSYSFDNNFQYIKKYIESADLALCNLETTFAGGTYSGYPVFNAPESLANALKNAGFDVALTSNNHIMDMGLSGMKRTLEICRSAGLQTAGTQLEGEKNYTIVDVKNVKIGIVAYTYETPSANGRTTINSNYVPEDALDLFNTFNYNTLDEDLGKIQASIQAARDQGAELIICYYHWGEEYQRSPNDYQLYIARQSVKFGADLIFASHPHVLQGLELLTDETSGKKVPVFYSMGNLLSNQRTETLDNRYTEQGMIAEVDLEYMKSTGQILTVQMGAVPTWVDKYKSRGKDVYAVIPLDQSLEENPDLKASGHLSRAKQALADVVSLLGNEFIRVNE
ncbi:CapA family protein [Sinanaerobacter chloroacetimidivorans]|uniref:CapA family protein n=1 Tax=Sinanaerobacter chloroacetimidivorans TaxID=2818044 RepID=A0A8J7W2S2_9FIRM|nr:CapA family protein [Sinanaerobacter chloroacetimidivorans]MBR0598051.1 CapA family protein [Sinanaerobacter chloroacetimidivorans]